MIRNDISQNGKLGGVLFGALFTSAKIVSRCGKLLFVAVPAVNAVRKTVTNSALAI
jgi:hypothetical protein